MLFIIGCIHLAAQNIGGFEDAQWTNKRRMSDEKMLDLIEHFSKINLSIENVPHDLTGVCYGTLSAFKRQN